MATAACSSKDGKRKADQAEVRRGRFGGRASPSMGPSQPAAHTPPEPQVLNLRHKEHPGLRFDCWLEVAGCRCSAHQCRAHILTSVQPAHISRAHSKNPGEAARQR